MYQTRLDRSTEILLRRISVLRVRAAAPAGALSGRASSSAPEKKQSASRAAFFELCIRRGSKGAPARRRKDRCAPSRVVTRDIRPLVLLLLSEKSHAASLLLAYKCARDAPTCYQLFSVSDGQADFIFTNRCRCRLFAVSCGKVSFCRERAPSVPR